jgi:hypothetical protein
MTKKEAILLGKDVADEIIAYGDFTEEEKENEESFRSAFYEIAENRKQYAGDCTEDFRRENDWEGYEEGLMIALDRYCKKNFK